jgi:hypothetical protein
MKKLIALTLALLLTSSAFAGTWWFNGVLFGNVCRSGGWYFVFQNGGYPVGNSCWFTLPGAGSFQGVITTE